LDLQLSVQSVPIPTIVVSSNSGRGEVYPLQHYVMKFVVSVAGWWFSLGTLVSSTNKTDRHDITEIVESGVEHLEPNQT